MKIPEYPEWQHKNILSPYYEDPYEDLYDMDEETLRLEREYYVDLLDDLLGYEEVANITNRLYYIDYFLKQYNE